MTEPVRETAASVHAGYATLVDLALVKEVVGQIRTTAVRCSCEVPSDVTEAFSIIEEHFHASLNHDPDEAQSGSDLSGHATSAEALSCLGLMVFDDLTRLMKCTISFYSAIRATRALQDEEKRSGRSCLEMIERLERLLPTRPIAG